MKKIRDEIIASNPIYQGETWLTLGVEHLHDVCRLTAQRCKAFVEPMAKRFANLKSLTALQNTEETTWLIDGLDLWFTKKWNNKRIADAKKATEPPKKRKLPTCAGCGHLLCCPDCDDVEHEAQPWINISDRNS